MKKLYVDDDKLVHSIEVTPAPAGSDTPNNIDMFLINGYAYDTDKVYQGHKLYDSLDELKAENSDFLLPYDMVKFIEHDLIVMYNPRTKKQYIVETDDVIDNGKNFYFNTNINKVRVAKVEDISYGDMDNGAYAIISHNEKESKWGVLKLEDNFTTKQGDIVIIKEL